MCSSVDYWRCRWIKLGGALEYPQRGPSDPHLEPDLSTVCPQGYPQGWRADPQGWRGGTRRCGGARASPRRRRGRRRAGPTGRSASRSPCGRAGRPRPGSRSRSDIQVPVREGGAGSSSSAAAHRGAPTTPLAPGRAVGAITVARSPVRHPLAPGRAVRSKPWGSIRGGREPQGRRPRLRPIRAPPSGRPSRPGCSDGGHRRSAIADQDRVGAGGPPGSARMRGGGCAGSAADSSAGPPGSTRARAVRWTPLHAGPSPHPSRSPRPSRRGHGRSGGGAIRRLKKVAGAYLSPPAPRSSRPEVAQ